MSSPIWRLRLTTGALWSGNWVCSESTRAPSRSVRKCLPIELEAATKPGRAANTPLYKIYQQMGIRSKDKVAASDRFDLCVTEHIFDENTRYLCLINYTSTAKCGNITLDDGWRLAEAYSFRGGETVANDCGFAVTLPENTGLLVKISR